MKALRYNESMEIYRQSDLRDGDEIRLRRDGNMTTYTLLNGSGEGTVEAHELFCGAQLLFDDMHMDTFGEGGARVSAFVVEHCRSGRFEGTFCDGRQFFLGAGDVCVHNVVDRNAFASCFPTRHYHGATVMLNLPEGDFAEFLRISGIDLAALAQKFLSKDISCVIRGDAGAGRIFADIYAAREKRDIGYFRLKLAELLHFLQRYAPNAGIRRTQTLPADIVRAMKDAEEYLWRHLSVPLSIGGLSEKFGFSPTSFKHYFKMIYGFPVHEYLFTCRMQIAQHELVKTNKKISAIAREAGYKNVSKFSEAFKRFSGISPRAYRGNHVLSEWSIFMPARD